MLFGCSTKFIVADGRLYPGTWQTFFFRTADGLRERYAFCFQVIGLQQMDEKYLFAVLHSASRPPLHARYQTICALPV